MQEEKTEALAFVTKKVLVTFYPHVCLMVGENAVFTQAAICEYQQDSESNRRMDIPNEFTVIGLAEGKKLAKSIHLRTNGFQSVTAMAELE